MWIALRNFILPVLSALAPNWDYNGITGPGYWQDSFPACGGRYQSPVDIVTTNTTGNYSWSPLGFKRYEVLPSNVTLVNNGLSVHMIADFLSKASIQGEALGGKYIFDYVNFHWGRNDSLGSEHTIDGRSHPLEIHLVHFKSEYGSVADALKRHDGIVILAIFVAISPVDNRRLSRVVDGLKNIIDPYTNTDLKAFSIKHFLPSNTTQFYKYQGSLSTPPCEEVVTWIVFQTPLEMSNAQLEKFRKLKNRSGNPMVDNFRPLQPLNGRPVFSGMDTPHWSYADQDRYNWGRYFELCSGLSQSPINLANNSAMNITTGQRFYFDYYKVSPAAMFMTNNGHTALLSLASTLPPTVYGGGFVHEYRFMQLHFHWGVNNSMGSEHTLNNRRFPSELHIVNFKAAYGNPKEAVKHADGISVLGVLLQLDIRDNDKLNSIISGLDNITIAGQSTNIVPFPLSNLLPENLDEFFRYKGSLTTPACNEVVTWTVFKQPINISEAQVSKFRNLEDETGHRILNTFRPLKSVNGRVVLFANLN